MVGWQRGLTCQSTRTHNSRRRLRRLCWWSGHFYVRHHRNRRMDKQFVVFQLEHTAQIFVLGMASVTLLASPEARPILQVGKAQFGTFEVTFDQVVTLLENPKAGP